jgi:hypothetical protein
MKSTEKIVSFIVLIALTSFLPFQADSQTIKIDRLMRFDFDLKKDKSYDNDLTSKIQKDIPEVIMQFFSYFNIEIVEVDRNTLDKISENIESQKRNAFMYDKQTMIEIGKRFGANLALTGEINIFNGIANIRAKIINMNTGTIKGLLVNKNIKLDKLSEPDSINAVGIFFVRKFVPYLGLRPKETGGPIPTKTKTSELKPTKPEQNKKDRSDLGFRFFLGAIYRGFSFGEKTWADIGPSLLFNVKSNKRPSNAGLWVGTFYKDIFEVEFDGVYVFKQSQTANADGFDYELSVKGPLFSGRILTFPIQMVTPKCKYFYAAAGAGYGWQSLEISGRYGVTDKRNFSKVFGLVGLRFPIKKLILLFDYEFFNGGNYLRTGVGYNILNAKLR